MEMNAANVAQHNIFSISFWRPEVTSLSGRFSIKFSKTEGLEFNKTIIAFALVGYEPRWLFTISYPTRAHGIIVNYTERKSCFPEFYSAYANKQHFIVEANFVSE